MFIERPPKGYVCVWGGGGGKGVTPDSSDRDGDRDDRMREKLKTEKNPQGFKQNPKKSLDQKNLTAKISHDQFPSHKIFPESVKNPKKVIASYGLLILAKIFLPPPPPKKKITKSKISNPRRSFDHPCHLKSEVTPPPPNLGPLLSHSQPLWPESRNASLGPAPVGTRPHGGRGSGVTTALLSARKIE